MSTQMWPRLIKRYKNRKLYDTVASAYVTYTDISNLIKAGEKIHVMDNETTSDLTVSTLIAVLYDNERMAETQPSRLLLEAAIKAGDGTLTGFLETQLSRVS